jgi:general secretion pathway protein G
MGRFRRREGFTLVELLVVMAIIAILSGVGLFMHNNAVIRARETVLSEDLYKMREAIDRYYADKNKWPSSLDALVEDKYMRAVPIDPITNAPDWQTTVGEPDPSNPSSESGISDVHSASDQVSPFNGKPYAEW